MSKKAIIFVCQRVPYPPDRGDRITTWNFVRHLSDKYDIHLFCLASEKKELNKKSFLENYCKSVNIHYKSKWKSYLDIALTVLFSDKPLSNAFYFSKKIEAQINDLAKNENIELAYVYSSNVFSHVFKLKTKKVFHLADVDSEKWKSLSRSGAFLARPLYYLEFLRLRKWELECAKIATCSVLCTEKEKQLFSSAGASGDIYVIKNGVDTEYFRPDPEIKKEKAIIFTGVMDYFPNIDAVLYFHNEIFQKIKKEEPDVKFYIVGRNPNRQVKTLSRKDANCIVTGYVDDIRPLMNKSMVFVAPIRVAQGIQNKILEALSMELPVVTNSEILHSLSAGEFGGLIVADTPEEMSRKVVELLRNAELRYKFSKSARQAVLESYSWDRQLQELDKMLNSII